MKVSAIFSLATLLSVAAADTGKPVLSPSSSRHQTY